MEYRVPYAGVDLVRLSVETARPLLINRDPEPDETRVPATTIVALEITDIGGTGIDLAKTKVYINDTKAFDGDLTPKFQAGFDGPGSDYTLAGLSLTIAIDPETDFTSRSVVPVLVESDVVGGGHAFLETYFFTVQDTDGLQLDTVLGWAQRVVRVVYDYPVDPDTAGNPDNYSIERRNVFPQPAVNVSVTAARIIDSQTVDLDLDIPITPGVEYLLTLADGMIFDEDGWPCVAPSNTATFTWSPPTVTGRQFDLYNSFSSWMRQRDRDEHADMEALIGCWEECWNLVLYEVDRWNSINDPQTAEERFVLAGLYLYGNPFSWLEMDLVRMRRLMENLVGLYDLKGTDVGIEASLRLLMDLDSEVWPYNRAGWRLGRSRLGVDTRLNIGSVRGRNSFDIRMTAAGIGQPGVNRALTADEEKCVRRIAEWMKPANMHLINVISPYVAP